MSHPDYEQQAHHHSCLLILIRGIGQSKPRSLQKIFERIQQVNNVKIKGTHTLHCIPKSIFDGKNSIYVMPFLICVCD